MIVEIALCVGAGALAMLGGSLVSTVDTTQETGCAIRIPIGPHGGGVQGHGGCRQNTHSPRRRDE